VSLSGRQDDPKDSRSVPRQARGRWRGLREDGRAGYGGAMKLLRGVAAVGIAKKVYSEARKPQNQARIKSAVAKMRSRGDRPR